MNLHVQFVGDAAVRPAAEQAWADFETSFALPFAYEKPAVFSVCDDFDADTLAAAQIGDDGVAMIAFTRNLLDAPQIERHLTLLHESLHVASLSGPLREMYAATTRFADVTYPIEITNRILKTLEPEDWSLGSKRRVAYYQIADLLGKHLYEVDVELAFGEQYPKLIAARNEYFVKLREQGFTSYPYTNVAEWCRAYWILLDRLRAELGGVLAGDDSVTRGLWGRIEQVPGFIEPADENEMTALHRMLSPKWNNFTDLSKWGAATYEAVLRRVTEKAFTLGSL